MKNVPMIAVSKYVRGLWFLRGVSFFFPNVEPGPVQEGVEKCIMTLFQEEHSDKAFQNINSKCHVTEGIQGRYGFGREGVGIGEFLRVFSNFMPCFLFFF